MILFSPNPKASWNIQKSNHFSLVEIYKSREFLVEFVGKRFRKSRDFTVEFEGKRFRKLLNFKHRFERYYYKYYFQIEIHYKSAKLTKRKLKSRTIEQILWTHLWWPHIFDDQSEVKLKIMMTLLLQIITCFDLYKTFLLLYYFNMKHATINHEYCSFRLCFALISAIFSWSEVKLKMLMSFLQ